MKTPKTPKMPKRLERVYEGPETLARLLSVSGSKLTVEDVEEEFAAALEEGTPAAEVIPLLWEAEPRFKSAELARQTFSNLLGLWDLVSDDVVGELVMPDQDPTAPLTPEFVDRAWLELDGLSDRDLRRVRDRFDNVQHDLAVWTFERLREASPTGQELALDLAFETWWVCERARGEKGVPRAFRAALDAAFADADRLSEEPEPALASLVSATLWEQAADEAAPLPEEDIGRIEPVLRAARHVLAPRPAG
ncbi:hypothetical protein L6V77_31870 [Myxococcota bacterium]|jgi:hypothetical protein|nr:hypothetical protein [Myxococcota bacterium]